MKSRRFGQFDFEWIGRIEPERRPDGIVIESMPQDRYRNAATAPLNAYGAGPFCRFRIGKGRNEPGLYVLTLDDEPVYVGECANLATRWGLTQYGAISPKNCFKGGQSTNCRVNSSILVHAKLGQNADLWFCPGSASALQRRSDESALIQTLLPNWNKAKIT